MNTQSKVDIQNKTWISIQEEAKAEKTSLGRKLRLIENFSVMYKQGLLKVEDYMPSGSNKQFFDLFNENKTITNAIQLAFLTRVMVKSLKQNTETFKEKFPLEFNVLREITPSVIMVIKEDCFKYDLKKIGPLVENNDLFPEKINLTFAQVKDSSNILVNVWERGAGLTKACGTAACATGVAAFEKKLTDNKINIHFKEGFLNIEYNKLISMTGPVSDIKEIIIKL